MYGIADLDNFYCSCEKVFRPDLEGKPIVVLSNNDGCIVARSNEAKKMGIKEGTPYFQLAQHFPGQKIAVFSSNYELYGELTGRDHVPSGVAQRPVKIEYNQFYAHVSYSIRPHFISSPSLSYCLRLPTGGSVRVMRTTAVRSRLRAIASSKASMW